MVDEKNGANSYIDWIYSSLSNHCDITLLSAFHIHTPYGIKKIRSVNNRTSLKASLNVIFFKKQYFVERLVPKNFLLNIDDFYSYDIVIFSFIHTYLAALEAGFVSNRFRKVIILTHNYDPDIYKSWENEGFFKALIGKISLSRYFQSLKKIDTKVILGNISESDSHLYRNICSNKSVEIPSGAVVNEIFLPIKADKIKIVFLGSLSTPFNINGLNYFKDKIFRTLKMSLDFDFYVIGSNPTNSVKNLCIENNWILIENPSDQELENILKEMSFGILPFNITQGVKVKIWSYLSMGLPILATDIFKDYDFPSDIYLASDNLDQWVVWIQKRFNNLEFRYRARNVFDMNSKISSNKVIKEILI